MPLDENGNILGDVKSIDFENTDYVCLNCYTSVIQKRTERKNQASSRLASADAVRSKAVSQQAERSYDYPRQNDQPRNSAIINKQTLDKLLVKKPAAVIAKPSAPASVKASAGSKAFQAPVSAVEAYKLVKTTKPEAKPGAKPGPKKPKKQPRFRQKTDISHFANAMFNGGVYKANHKKSI